MTRWRLNDSRDSAHMLHSILKQDQWFGILLLKVSSHVDSLERGFSGFSTDLSEIFQMGSADQTITIDSLTLMEPKFGDLLDVLEVLWSGQKDTSE